MTSRFVLFARSYPAVVAVLTAGIVVFGLKLAGLDQAAFWVGTGFVLIMILLTAWDMIKQMLRGHFGLDILALVAMISTLAVGEYIAALIVVLMITGGEALEDYADHRSRRELSALLDRNPTRAHRYRVSETVANKAAQIGEIGCDATPLSLNELEQADPEDVGVEDIAVGDLLLVRPNEVVPVDAVLVSDSGEFDTSSLTGESLPVEHHPGDEVLSGETNGVQAALVRVLRPHNESAFQRIIQLVREAENAQAPTVRLADRWAVPFTIVSLAIAGLAWLISGQAVRFAEVLVLATPCPLLLAAPVAFLGGLSTSSRLGVVVKGGGVLEKLSAVKSLAVDKTGTMTRGEPQLVDIRPAAGVDHDELLQLAASAEQYSTHAFARSIVQAADAQGITRVTAEDASEYATNGVRARVSGRDIVVGKSSFAAEAAHTAVESILTELTPGQTAAYVTVDGRFVGALVLADEIRPEAPATLDRLRQMGITHTVMLTGDAEDTGCHIASQLGIEDVRAQLLPEDKVSAVKDLSPRPVLMVGDGVNDAPVLAAADVGIALGATGATAAGEAADAVVLRDTIDAIPNVVATAKRTMRIARQSIIIGIALSIGLMLVATTGVIPAVIGALTQEVVDLAAIGWAMLALRTPKEARESAPDPHRSDRVHATSAYTSDETVSARV